MDLSNQAVDASALLAEWRGDFELPLWREVVATRATDDLRSLTVFRGRLLLAVSALCVNLAEQLSIEHEEGTWNI